MSSITNIIRPDLRQFRSYRSARDEASHGEIWLNANESPFTSLNTTATLNRYPTKQPAVLVDKLSYLYGVQANQLCITRGSDEAIDLLVRLCCSAEKDAVMQFSPTFGMYATCAALQNAKVIDVPLNPNQHFSLQIERIFQLWNPSVKIIFLCSPNNPTGNLIKKSDVFSLCERYENRSLIVVDEAYVEFSDESSFSEYLSCYSNLVVLRTLSKAYGLAGARVGALLAAPEWVDYVRAILAPYPLPTTTIQAVLSALSENNQLQHQQRICLIKKERTRLLTRLKKMSFVQQTFESAGNFLLFRVKDSQAVMTHCLENGIVLRHMHGKLNLDQCLRISIGTPAENNAALICLERFP